MYQMDQTEKQIQELKKQIQELNLFLCLIRHLYRNVAVSKDLIHRFIDSMDGDGDGRISLSELAIALKMLWKKALGKEKVKRSKVKYLD